MHSIVQTFAACSLIGVASPVTLAQDAPDDRGEGAADAAEQVERAGRPGVSLTLTPRGYYSAERDFSSNTGTIEATSFGAELGFAIPAGDRGRLNLSVSFDTTDLDITPSATGLVGTNAASISSQFDAINEFGVQGIYFQQINQTTSVFVGGGVGFASEGGADLNDSFVWNVLGGVSYQVNPNLRIGGGIGVFAQLEDGVRIIPIPQVTLRLNEQWSLESERAGLKLNYKWDDTTNYGVMARFEGNDYRIDTDNTLLPGGAVSSTAFPITAYVDLARNAGNANIGLFAEAGILVGGEMEFFNAAGVTVVQENIDAGVFASLRLRIRF